MEFIKHKHPLIQYDYYHGVEGDICYICEQRFHPPFAYSVYRCTRGMRDFYDDCDKMLLHKSCAELPLQITDYFMHPQHSMTLYRPISRYHHIGEPCSICSHESSWIVYSCKSCNLTVCLNCVTSQLVNHPSHNQHTLALVQRKASFRCDACGDEASDSSSCRCSTCPYWIHNSCALLSSPFNSQFHRHPLLLAYSLPQEYLNFKRNCKICKRLIKPTLWLYYCAGCRFFLHLQCAKKTRETTMRPLGEFGDLVHLPSRDESSLNSLQQLLIQQMVINQGEADALTWSFRPISTVKAAAGPDKELIHHWSHYQHPLILNNKRSTPNTQLMTLKDTIMVCDGCTNPINSSNTSYYECHPCKHFLHRYCAELPKQMQPYKFPYEIITHLASCDDYQIVFTEISSSYLFKCDGCNYLKSGIYIATDDGNFKLDIGCAMLPSKIKHGAHEHPLTHLLGHERTYYFCNACGLRFRNKELFFRCSVCEYFNLHAHCALRPHKLKHRWDSHALTLITPENIIENHPHDYNCEHCSDDIDTNYWFYHCSLCDLSVHISCINEFYRYSKINFRASNIKIDQQLHEHGLTLVLNKRKRCCGSCHRRLYYEPILQCTPCNFDICLSCVHADISVSIS